MYDNSNVSVQATSKKRERQVGEAQGALVMAQAQVSGLEQQIRELTAAHRQVYFLCSSPLQILLANPAFIYLSN